MKPFLRRAIEVLGLGVLLLLITYPVAYPVWAQALTLMQGRTSAGRGVPVRVDANGALAANVILSGVNATWTFSQVTVSSAQATQATVANPLRKALLIFNTDGVPIFTGLTSPVSSTTAFSQAGSTVFPPAGTGAVPNNTIFVKGQATGSAQTVTIFEGQ